MLHPMAQILDVQEELQFINCRQLIAKFMVFCNSSVTSFSVLLYLYFLFLGINSMSWENLHGTAAFSINPEIWGVLPNYQLNVFDMNPRFGSKFGHGVVDWSSMYNVTPEYQFIQLESRRPASASVIVRSSPSIFSWVSL